MRTFVLRRVGAALIVVFLASVVVFAGTRALPGDPALLLAGENRDPASLAAIRAKYQLDQPFFVQYGSWLAHAVQGDFGESRRSGISVGSTIVDRIPITLELALLAIIIAIILGIPAGVIAAVRRGRPEDYVATAGALVGLSVPHFWLGLLFIIWFAVDLHWLPASGYVTIHHPIANLEHMVMPAIVLGT